MLTDDEKLNTTDCLVGIKVSIQYVIPLIFNAKRNLCFLSILFANLPIDYYLLLCLSIGTKGMY